MFFFWSYPHYYTPNLLLCCNYLGNFADISWLLWPSSCPKFLPQLTCHCTMKINTVGFIERWVHIYRTTRDVTRQKTVMLSDTLSLSPGAEQFWAPHSPLLGGFLAPSVGKLADESVMADTVTKFNKFLSFLDCLEDGLERTETCSHTRCWWLYMLCCDVINHFILSIKTQRDVFYWNKFNKDSLSSFADESYWRI